MFRNKQAVWCSNSVRYSSFECYKSLHPEETFNEPSDYIKDILDTWGDIKPKFHVSEQGNGRVGKHSDYIDVIPEYLLEIPDKYGVEIDIMIEAKMKELSIQKLYEKYTQCNCKILEKNDDKIFTQSGIIDGEWESSLK